MNIKFKAKRVRSFDVTVNDVSLGRFDLASEWNGFSELVRADGQRLIVADRVFSLPEIFADIFRNEEEQELLMVKASPDLIVLMNGPKISAAPKP